MTNPYPIPRETRESQVLVGDGVSQTYGPFQFKIFDTVDVLVLTKAAGQSEWVETDVYVNKTTNDPLSFFTITFPGVLASTTEFYVCGNRLQERTSDVTQGGALRSDELEKEESKQSVVLQEVRRDVGRALRFPPDYTASALLPVQEVGRALIWGPRGLENGPNAEEIEFAEEYAEEAKEARDGAVTARNEAVAAAGTVVNKIYESRTYAETQVIDTSAPLVITGGYANAGDEGGAEYFPSAGLPDHQGYFQDAAGKVFAITKRSVNLKQFGFDYSDLTGVANKNAFDNAIGYIKSVGGGQITVPGEDFFLSERVRHLDTACDISIIGAPGNNIRAVSGFNLQMLQLAPRQVFYQTTPPIAGSINDLWFDKAASDSSGLGNGYRWDGSTWVLDPSLTGNDIYYPATLETNNLQMDCSLGADDGFGQTCSGIVATYWRNWFAYDNRGYGGESATNPNADSFLSPVACYWFHFGNNSPRGFADAAFYVGGDNKKGAFSGDGAGGLVEGGLVERCSVVGATKRELSVVRFKDMTLNENRAGFISLEVEPGLAGVGREMHIESCRILKNETRAIEFRAGAKGSVSDTIFRDWATTGVAGTGAIIFNGASGISLRDNTFERVELPDSSQIGVIINNATIDGVAYTGGRITGSGNTYRNIGRMVAETTGVDPSVFNGEILDAPIGSSPGTWFNFTNNASVADYCVVGETAKRTRFASNNSRQNAEVIIVQPAGATLGAGDTGKIYSNGGATALTVFNLPGAEIGLKFGFMCLDADGIRVVAASGDVIRVNGAASSAAGHVDNTGAVGTYIELMAHDTTNWVATRVVGTWTVT
ncbi:hypothetical protein M1D80_11785 [Phyllobacteriaceae bacterium JZ32]